MVQTIKFSQFATANLSDSSNQLVGLSGSNNSRIKNVVTWTTSTRPSAPYNGLMGINADLEVYEYYNANLAEWVQFSSSGDVSQIYARLAAHTLGDGASLIGLQNEGSSVVNKTVQNLALASFIVNTNNGSMLNAQATGDLSSGILKNTTITGILSISQPLTSIDGLTTTTNDMLYLTAPNVYGVIPTTAFGQSVLNLSANQGGIFYSGLTTASLLAGTNVAGRILQSGNLASPTWSVPTYPSISGTSGQVLSSDGTNVIYSTATFPVSAGAAGSIFISDGTNIINSTSLWPNTVGTAGKILRSNGTINTYTTSTFADTYAINTLLYASSANTVSGLATANSSVLVTSAGGVPSLSTTLPSGLIIPGYQPTITAAALTKTDDTNVTLTLGGSPTSALLAATSLTLGWTGQLGLTRGGTAASLTASNGGIIYSTASALAVLAGTATANQMLMSGASTAPQWSTTTYPLTNAINTLMYASSANVLTALATANSSFFQTNGSGVPGWQNASTTTTALGVPVLTANNAYTAQNTITPVAITSSSNLTAWNLNTAPNATYAAVENSTLSNPSNGIAGTYYTIKFVQNASAAKTFVTGSAYKYPLGIVPVVSTTLSAVDLYTFYYDGTNMLCCGIAQNIS